MNSEGTGQCFVQNSTSSLFLGSQGDSWKEGRGRHASADLRLCCEIPWPFVTREVTHSFCSLSKQGELAHLIYSIVVWFVCTSGAPQRTERTPSSTQLCN